MPGHRTIPLVPASADAIDDAPDSAARRRFLQLTAASMALAGGACSGPPAETIVPYVRMPEGMVPGEPLYYATALTRRGTALGVLVESNMGRPTKVEGNARHPSSLGATEPFAQAAVLQFWDPDRSQTPRANGQPASWDAFTAALAAQRAGWARDGGAGLRILTGPVVSPTLAAQLADLLARYPRAAWHSHDPLDDGTDAEAARLAFGQPLDVVYRFDLAQTIVTLDADVFGDWAGAVRYARDSMQERRASAPGFARRHYALEASPALTGAIADNRIALPPQEIERMAWRLAATLGLPEAAQHGMADSGWARALAARLRDTRGGSVLVAGRSLSPATRALVHRLNGFLGNTGSIVIPIEPVAADRKRLARNLPDLAAAMHAGAVRALLVLDSNPVYDAPADLRFASALARVPFTVHHGLYADETGVASAWHLPLAHAFEQWSDARGHDGTASIVQPLIAPLHGGRAIHTLPAMAIGITNPSAHDLVRDHWRRRMPAGDFDAAWRDALQAGVIDGTAAPVAANLANSNPLPPPTFEAPPLRALFVPDPSASLGEFANNGWLQELPRPLTGLTWDNAVFLGPATARKLGVRTGDVVRLATGGTQARVDAPVLVTGRQAEGVATLPLGYGRVLAGRVGNRVGFNAYALRSTQPVAALTIDRTNRRHDFASTRQRGSMEGRPLVPVATADAFRRTPGFATQDQRMRTPEASLYPPWPYERDKWGMAIDLNACIGCNACTIACQAENNIPVVGKEQVMRGREMHWIRVDRYDIAASDRSAFQPVPCMHCEDAPCEAVCPVGATVHDSEGLNVQVYNRCVGTRFCSNNCPYKVRRFNFLDDYGKALARPPATQNPDVTVRRGGVMEKCSYCLQRITRARLAAEKLGRPLRDGEVVTACQAACPTAAIVFGNLNDPHSAVVRAKSSPLDYALLAELNTRPRTTYAALVVNPDAALRDGADGAAATAQTDQEDGAAGTAQTHHADHTAETAQTHHAEGAAKTAQTHHADGTPGVAGKAHAEGTGGKDSRDA